MGRLCASCECACEWQGVFCVMCLWVCGECACVYCVSVRHLVCVCVCAVCLGCLRAGCGVCLFCVRPNLCRVRVWLCGVSKWLRASMWHALGALCLRAGAGRGWRVGEAEGFEGGVCLGWAREDCWLPWEGP